MTEKSDNMLENFDDWKVRFSNIFSLKKKMAMLESLKKNMMDLVEQNKIKDEIIEKLTKDNDEKEKRYNKLLEKIVNRKEHIKE